MVKLTARVIGAIMALSVIACADEALDPPDCDQERPDGYGQNCSGDGECPLPLVCQTECILPETMSGSEGSAISVGDSEFRAEFARSDLARSRGLSGRVCMTDGWALVIEFPTTGRHPLETSSMLYDIDVAFVDELGNVTRVMRDLPAGAKALWVPNESYRYAIETRSGDLASVSPGDVYQTPTTPR